eukprot:TRINITY_DN18868_c0_g1_i1.p1 TRINITY_DN18868_c0_g1~~TRINITY_DN18868_c0_g1_i1.p1  ORF type:complete len:392 (+),score=47.57 TRINITY_DN18868_c0_g1_i1:60-1178(+)
MTVGRVIGRTAAHVKLGKRLKMQVGDGRITGLSWTDDGLFLAHRTKGGEIGVTSMEKGYEIETDISSNVSYGCGAISFSSNPSVCLYGATVVSPLVLAYDICHGQLLRIFSIDQQTGPVTKIVRNIPQDTFLTSTTNGNIQLWDCRHQQPLTSFLLHNKASMEGNISAISPDGTRMALSSGLSTINFYDTRNYGAGPYWKCRYTLDDEYEGSLQSLEFNRTGDALALKEDDCIMSIPVENATQQAQISPIWYEHPPIDDQQQDFLEDAITPGANATWSPSGNLTSGSDDGAICCWEADGSPVKSHGLINASTRHSSSVGPVSWNPRREILASACHVIYLWIAERSNKRPPSISSSIVSTADVKKQKGVIEID